MRRTLAELRDRQVFKVATAYLVVGGIVLQFGSLLLQNFAAPAWVAKAFTALVFLGFPLACLLAWALELTPEGIRRTRRDPGQLPEPRHTDWIWGALLAVTLVFVVVDLALDRSAPATPVTATVPAAATTAAPSRPAEVIPSVAVLPFVDMSAGHDQQYFGDGIAEELLSALARIEGLRVAARTSTFVLHGKGASMQEIGDTLKVAHVLEGSVRRSGERVRITAQLIDVKTGYHLFSQSYDRGIEDVLAIQDEIARELVGSLMPRLGLDPHKPLIAGGTADPEAHELRLKARPLFARVSPASLLEAVELLERAVALDPDYAAAWGDLSYAYNYRANFVEPFPQLLRGQVAANRALALDPGNALALIGLGSGAALVDYDQRAAEQYLLRARDSGSDAAFWAFNFAWGYLFPHGRYAEALQILQQARDLDPLAPPALQAEMFALTMLGRDREALALARTVHAADSPPPVVAYMALICCRAAADDLAAVDELLAYIVANFGEHSLQASWSRMVVNVRRGDTEANRQLLADLSRRRGEGLYVSPFAIAALHGTLEDHDAACDWLQRALDGRDPMLVYTMPLLRRLVPALEQHPRFLALMQRMGLDKRDELKAVQGAGS